MPNDPNGDDTVLPAVRALARVENAARDSDGHGAAARAACALLGYRNNMKRLHGAYVTRDPAAHSCTV